MDGRAFLAVAREAAQGMTEAHWRTAAGRAYYALMLEARDALARWGVPAPPGNSVHAFVRHRLIYSHFGPLKNIGYKLEQLVQLRNEADYRLGRVVRFLSGASAHQAIADADAALLTLDAIERDSQQRAAAIAAVRATEP